MLHSFTREIPKVPIQTTNKMEYQLTANNSSALMETIENLTQKFEQNIKWHKETKFTIINLVSSFVLRDHMSCLNLYCFHCIFRCINYTLCQSPKNTSIWCTRACPFRTGILRLHPFRRETKTETAGQTRKGWLSSWRILRDRHWRLGDLEILCPWEYSRSFILGSRRSFLLLGRVNWRWGWRLFSLLFYFLLRVLHDRYVGLVCLLKKYTEILLQNK